MADFLDGYTEFDKKPPVIYINELISYEKRKRFTIAHELGHNFISWHDDVTICQTDNYVSNNMLDIQEREANIFASELLMPSEWVKEKVNLYNSSSLKKIIEDLSAEANTSIMACVYALEEAYDSGNVIIVTRDGFEYGRKFIAKNTCTTRFKGLSFEDVCEKFSLYKEQFNISYYKIEYYKLHNCPSINEVRQAYNINHNIEYMLKNISNNNIFSLLHCLETIVSYKENDIISKIVSEECSIRFEYNSTKEQIMSEIISRFNNYDDVAIRGDIGLIWVKEDIYEENELWKNSTEDSTEVLRQILFEVYGDDAKIHKINGVIGITYGRNQDNNREEIYNKIKISLENKDYLVEFVEHEYFEKFISLRINEIFKRHHRN